MIAILDRLAAHEARSWRRRPWLGAAITAGLLILGLLLMNLSVPAVGSILLLAFLFEVFVWFTKVRGKNATGGGA
jgi:hypothetical protein